MEELKRIFFNRKLLVTFVLLWMLNGWLVYQGMQPEKEIQLYYQENYTGDYEADELAVYLECLEEYREKGLKKAEEELALYWELYFEKISSMTDEELQNTMLTENDLEQSAMSELDMQIQYLTGYGGYLESVRQNAEDMKGLSALGGKGSFSEKNIDKTVKAFEKLEDVVLSLDNERAVNDYIQNDITGYILLLFTMLLVLRFLEERKKGLWQFVYSMPGGRGKLAVKRCTILFLGVMAAGMLLEMQSLGIIGFVNGGFGDLTRPVQSNMNFGGCTILWSMGQYLFVSLMIKILVAFFFGILHIYNHRSTGCNESVQIY